LLCIKKSPVLFLFYTLHSSHVLLTQLYDCGNQLIVIQLNLCIIFYALGIKTSLSKLVWALKILLMKNKLFLWMDLHNKILIKDNLCKRGCTGDSCVFCTSGKIVEHLFCHCPFMFDFWAKILTVHPQGDLLILILF
jgi:zinc-binding in reverse transcriptase